MCVWGGLEESGRSDSEREVGRKNLCCKIRKSKGESESCGVGGQST